MVVGDLVDEGEEMEVDGGEEVVIGEDAAEAEAVAASLSFQCPLSGLFWFC